MPIYWTDDKFSPLDMSKQARNWRQTPEGTDVRMANRADALAAVGEATNRTLGRHPAIHFHMPQPITSVDATQADATGAVPLYRWLRPDYWANGRSYDVRFLVAPRTSGTGNCYAEYEDGSYLTASVNTTVGSLQLCQDVRYAQYQVDRGATTSTEYPEGINTYNGFTILDMVVQDDQLDALDSTLHSVCDTSVAKTGNPVLAGLAEDIRSTFHDARRYNLGMAFCWAAQGVSATPGSTDATAIVVTSASLVNIIDQSVTTRDENTPGIMCPAYLKGRGVNTTVRVDVRVYAESSTDAIVRFTGPNGYAEVQVSGGLDWYAGETQHIDLSSDSNDLTDVTTARNKIDIMASVTAGGTLYIYGLAGWYTYE